jgi:hypothetical protein
MCDFGRKEFFLSLKLKPGTSEDREPQDRTGEATTYSTKTNNLP